ncbi:MAG: AAA family ATPase [Thiohalomonadales bacterium]
MQQILVVNSKGGAGKTTVSTNLASYFDNQGIKTGLMDYDPQGSSLHWLKIRNASVDIDSTIHGANAAKAKAGSLRSWQMNVPKDLGKLIIDAPAGASGILLQEVCARADVVIIPVAPSSIDVHATADFIKDLMLVGKVRRQFTRMAVVANRVRTNEPTYEPLEKFLRSLQIPFITRISDSLHFVKAAELGMGIYDLDPTLVEREKMDFLPLLKWIETCGEGFNKTRKIATISSLTSRRVLGS